MQQPRQRSRIIFGLLSLGLLVGVALMAGSAQAATGNGPYYAEPAWDQKLPAATRFIVLLDWSSQAVLDRETGLVWEQAPTTTLATPQTWFNARFTCANKAVGNRKDWRLPSVHELASLIDPTQANPALPLSHPFTNVLPTNYWSATTTAEGPTDAWLVFVGDGSVDTFNKSNVNQVWCVRGGMQAEAY